LPRPSSALKPSHSPDGVCVVGPYGGICLAFGEFLFVGASLFFAYVWCHFELFFAQFTASLLHHCWCGVASLFDSVFYVAELF
jgi:hypothetical protein